MTQINWTQVATAIGAFGALLQGFRNGHKADQIHILVNSNLKDVKDALERANALLLAYQKILGKDEVPVVASSAPAAPKVSP